MNDIQVKQIMYFWMKIEGNCKRFLVLKINNIESPEWLY